MISSETEYQKAREELDHLNRWLASLEDKQDGAHKPLTTASIRKMICRVQEELAEYEAKIASASPASGKSAESDDAGGERRPEGQH